MLIEKYLWMEKILVEKNVENKSLLKNHRKNVQETMLRNNEIITKFTLNEKHEKKYIVMEKYL